MTLFDFQSVKDAPPPDSGDPSAGGAQNSSSTDSSNGSAAVADDKNKSAGTEGAAQEVKTPEVNANGPAGTEAAKTVPGSTEGAAATDTVKPPEGGGAAPVVANEGATPDPTEELRKKIEKEFFEKYNVKSAEELEQKLKTPDAPETEEQKAERQQKLKADINHFGVHNKLFSNDDIVNLETLGKKTAEDVAFEKFAVAYRAVDKNKDASIDTIRDEFKSFYHLDSDNAVLKAEGEKQIKLIYDNELNPLKSKYDVAKTAFEKRNEMANELPKYEKFISEVVQTSIPKRLELVKGETPEDSIGYDIPETEVKEVEALLKNDEEFQRFLSYKGDTQQATKFFKEMVENIIFTRNKDKIITTVTEAARAQGLRAGSTTGASNPFPLKQTPEPVIVKDDITKEDDAKVQRMFRT